MIITTTCAQLDHSMARTVERTFLFNKKLSNKDQTRQSVMPNIHWKPQRIKQQTVHITRFVDALLDLDL